MGSRERKVVNVFFNNNHKRENLHIGNLHLPWSPDHAEGIIFGIDPATGRFVCSPSDSEGHVLVVGGSGTGKTSALLIPTLRHWSGNALVIDISGDITRNTPIPHKVVIGPSAEKYRLQTDVPLPWNPLSMADRAISFNDDDEFFHQIEKIAYALLPNRLNASDVDAYYTVQGRNVIIATFLAFYDITKPDPIRKESPFIDLCKQIYFHHWRDLFTAIDKQGNELASGHLAGLRGSSDNIVTNSWQAAHDAVKVFATDKRLQRCFERVHHSVGPDELESIRMFICIDDADLELYSPFLRLVTTQCLAYLSARNESYTTPVLLALDEFASLGKMDITPALRKLRKRHARIMLLTQSTADLDLIYGRDERMSMLNNFAYKAILSASDADTQRYIADLIGQQTTTTRTDTVNAQGGLFDRYLTTSYSETKDYIIQPADLAQLGNELILLHPQGHMRLRKHFYFKD